MNGLAVAAAVKTLTAERDALTRAIDALLAVTGTSESVKGYSVTPAVLQQRKGRKKGYSVSPAARERMRAAQQRRWERVRNAHAIATDNGNAAVDINGNVAVDLASEVFA